MTKLTETQKVLMERDGMTEEEAINGMSWDVIAHYMEDEARETAHSELAPCDNLSFLIRYLEITDHDLIIG